MARPRKKPGFDPEKEMEGLIDRVASEYGVFDDRDSGIETGCFGKSVHTPSLNEVAKKFGLNVTKTRKLLITAGAYSTRTSRQVQSLHGSGMPVKEIAERTGLSRAAVTSYLPYGRVMYRLNEISPNADRLRLYRGRRQAVEELSAGMQKSVPGHGADDAQKAVLWNAIELFQGYWFELEGMKYRYTLDEEGLHFMGLHFADLDADVARKAVDAAFEAAAGGLGRREGCPACLYPVFERFGVPAG